jgi:pyruvate/2-oxoglutarate/acetoin dehydrogenase E1 component
MSDDLATVHYRTKGGRRKLGYCTYKRSPFRRNLAFRISNGRNSELNKGIHVLVPRNLTKAAGFYNTMLQSDEPSLIVETLNGYRLKEKLPNNLGEFTVPVGKVEITKEGTDVTYGSTWRIVMEAAAELEKLGVNIEVIDIQSLMPFDLSEDILESVKKTNRLVVVDEDVQEVQQLLFFSRLLKNKKRSDI